MCIPAASIWTGPRATIRRIHCSCGLLLLLSAVLFLLLFPWRLDRRIPGTVVLQPTLGLSLFIHHVKHHKPTSHQCWHSRRKGCHPREVEAHAHASVRSRRPITFEVACSSSIKCKGHAVEQRYGKGCPKQHVTQEPWQGLEGKQHMQGSCCFKESYTGQASPPHVRGVPFHVFPHQTCFMVEARSGLGPLVTARLHLEIVDAPPLTGEAGHCLGQRPTSTLDGHSGQVKSVLEHIPTLHHPCHRHKGDGGH
mmetsp:Transcript_53013/g.124224  ORF Transcript_53013/g.124224 Transcript_53013/m.124224 type:complete len:252 (+) Transcript_53013:151-906(+)